MKKGLGFVDHGRSTAGVFFNPRSTGAEVELGRVVVTATKTRRKSAKFPIHQRITKEEIQNSPDRTIGGSFAPCGSSHAERSDGRPGCTACAGSTAGQVLILLNGQRLNDAQNGQFDLNNLPVAKEDIERIEVLRGGLRRSTGRTPWPG
jgi:outer membrane cobalamin receptor